MIVLGIAGAVSHDPSAALFIDGKLVAAAEEERFIRDKHAKGKFPYEATRFCLEQAGIKAKDVDLVGFPYAKIPLTSAARWHYAKRHLYAPDRALTAVFAGNRRYYRNIKKLNQLVKDLGIVNAQIKPIEHHLAHASSAYHLSGFKEKTAILGIDGKGEYASTFFGYGENGKIHKIKEFYDPDSLGGVYGALTEFLGFEMLDGEFKVMGMAPYGDSKRFDFSRLIDCSNGADFKVNTDYVNVVGLRRYKDTKGKGYFFSPKLIEWLGEPRQGDEIDDPYIDYAASMQALLEKVSLKLIDYYLGDILKETGKLCYAGGVALNVKLNQRIIAREDVNELFVQPAASDAGTAIGAASYLAHQAGDEIEPMQHAYLGPSYTDKQCINAVEARSEKCHWRKLKDTVAETAEILAQGNPISWFQGRMEFGPRALGNRSIIGVPNSKGIANRINEQIKYRERWRPFCPSILDRVAPEILQTEHPSPYMTFTFNVAEHWKERIPEVVHEDGTARAQVVTQVSNPRYYALLEAVEQKTGNAVLLNTSLNRRGEPMVCAPEDALNMFFGSDLEYLVMENILVTKL